MLSGLAPPQSSSVKVVVGGGGRLQRPRDVIAQHAQLSEGIACFTEIDIADPNSTIEKPQYTKYMLQT